MAAMKFSIRDLLLLTIIAALSVSWWIDRQSVVRERAALQTERKALADEKTRIIEELQVYVATSTKRLRDIIDEQERLGQEREAKNRPAWMLDQWIEPLHFPPDPNAL
jgi:hypothetical protein